MKTVLLFLCLFCCTALGSQHQTVYIYADKGASPESLSQALQTTEKWLHKHYKIKTIYAPDIISGKWRNDAALLIMPGGADIPYLKALNGKGNQQIKAYVHAGGSYLGLCAGGYYGSQNIVFSEGTPLEIKGPRELAFFKGTARGPALAPYDLNSNKGARVAHLRLANRTEASVYFNGGSLYEVPSMPQNTTVIARYADLPHLPAAIIKVKVGKGTVVLSGVHFEYDQSLMSSSDPYLAPIIITLKKHENERQKLLTSIFTELHLLPAL